MSRRRKTPIIFIDDEEFFLDHVRMAFQKIDRPWQPHFFRNPYEALQMICGLDECVVVTDWRMPELDGLELAKRVKKAQERAGGYYYVIVLTGKCGQEPDVEALLSGADDILHKPIDRVGMMARIQAGTRILDYIKRLHLMNQRLEIISSTDPLTGLFNRSKGRALLINELERCKRGKQDMCIIIANIDHFKSVNDTYGHEIGDEVIKQAASKLSSSIREYDIIARWGGEEFLLIAPHATKADGLALAERIRASFSREPFAINNEEINLSLTISQGLVTYSAVNSHYADISSESSSQILESIVKFADLALYEAKNAGRNKTVCYSSTRLKPAHRAEAAQSEGKQA